MQMATDPREPRHGNGEPGKAGALVFTLLVHGVLLAVLFFGVQWQRREPEAISVELVQPADLVAPPRPTPPPAPRVETPPAPPRPVEVEPPKPTIEPEVRIKEVTPDKKPEPRKPAPEPPPKPVEKPAPKPEPEPEPDPKPVVKPAAKPAVKPEPEQDRIAQLLDQSTAQDRRQELLKREASRVGTPSAGSSATTAELDAWRSAIRTKVKGNLTVLPAGLSGRPRAEFEIELMPDGTVLNKPILRKSSGNAALDEALERAVLRSSPLPLPAKKEAFQSRVIIQFDPLGDG